MWVCPISEQLRLGRLTAFEELRERDVLVDNLGLKADLKRGVVFFSHVWLGRSHPDPQNVKYDLMCEVLERAQAGLLDFQMGFEEELTAGWSSLRAKDVQEMLREGYVWLDYQSVPQQDPSAQQAYIDGLLLYVRHCTLFVALAPPALHQETRELVDIRAWSARGWCRAELLCNVLSDDPAPMLTVESLVSRRISTARDFIMHPVGSGHFTYEADRARISGMMNQLVGLRISTLRKLGSIFALRWLLTFQTRLLGDLAINTTEDSDMAAWLECMGFSSPVDQADTGWTPLRYAAYAGRLDLARKMIELGADVEAPLAQDCSRAALFHGRGMTILQGVAMACDSPEAVRLLVEARAQVNGTWSGGCSALFAAAFGGRADSLGALLDARADPLLRDGAGGNLLHAACAHGGARLLEVLQARCPQLPAQLAEAEGVGFGYLAPGLMLDRGGAEALQVALQLGADPNHRTTPRAAWLQALVRRAQAACFVSGRPTHLDAWAANAPGMTPLLWASYFGNLPAARLLLEHKADASAANEYGRSALVLAAMNGHRALCECLLEAGAPAGSRDVWGRSAEAWARLRGDAQLERTLSAPRP